MLSGYATAEGTTHYRDRFPSLRDVQHFRRSGHVAGVCELWLSSIGLGTYLGDPSDAADASYVDAIVTALRSGINVLDTAINYRHQRSERNIGEALRRLTGSGDLRRDEVLVCTKAGYLSFDGQMPPDPRGYFQREYVEAGILDPAQVAGGMHCMAPRYLNNQIQRSLKNLGLETIDVFYLHNPESQLGDVTREDFNSRLRDAFGLLEGEVRAGRLRYYGVATWNGFRADPDARDYLNLFELTAIAAAVGGIGHHFRFVQLPFNLAMPEAFGLANQIADKQKMSLLTAAQRSGIAVMGSATLYQGQLTRDLPEFVSQRLGTASDAEAAIQFSRSAPGLTSALIGMGRKDHVPANLKPALRPPTQVDDWNKLFTRQ
ncbi:MAG TPA: aldo/keto reductase [Terriglobales bacterium]|jgi:aryl-alcohol dehydrogenase-like predicted oxidoreductase